MTIGRHDETVSIGGGRELQHRPRIGIRGQLTGILIGAAGGLSVNILSSDYRYRAVLAALALAAILSGTGWIRRLPPRAPLARHSTSVLLGLALAAVIATLVAPRSWTGPAAFTVVGLVTAAVLIATDLITVVLLLSGTGCVGLGVQCMGLGIAGLADGLIVQGALVFGTGAAVTTWGLAALRRSLPLALLGLTGGGLLTAAFGIDVMIHFSHVEGLVLIALGIGLIAAEVAVLKGARRAVGLVGASLAIAQLVAGVAGLHRGDVALGALDIALGTALMVAGVGVFFNSRATAGAAVVGTGLGMGGLGLISLLHNQILSAATYTIVAAAGVSAGVMLLHRSELIERMRRGAAALTREPNPPRRGRRASRVTLSDMDESDETGQ
ncbi:hypothetical protein ACLQ3F_29890 [Micromonospora sp. DT15]|uniref:hypothetical protein n=1 Tax=Micromonospora sp. DT15 TaxID=3393445 RepID=UPI003CF77A98